MPHTVAVVAAAALVVVVVQEFETWPSVQVSLASCGLRFAGDEEQVLEGGKHSNYENIFCSSSECVQTDVKPAKTLLPIVFLRHLLVTVWSERTPAVHT